eukprot:13826759-Alexandrium_andersonii.AAC.1
MLATSIRHPNGSCVGRGAVDAVILGTAAVNGVVGVLDGVAGVLGGGGVGVLGGGGGVGVLGG